MDTITRSILHLQDKNYIPKEGMFDITEDLIEKYCLVYEVFSRSVGIGVVKPNFARKLAGLSLLRYKKSVGGTYKDIKEGIVYVITNPAWLTKLKIGMTIDLDERLKSYQTYSPLRDYKVEKYAFVQDRRAIEKELLNLVPDYQSEWVDISNKDSIYDYLNKVNYKKHTKIALDRHEDFLKL